MCKRLWVLIFLMISLNVHSQKLKWVIYDFDGLDIGQTNLPDGDFGSGDMVYKVSDNPFGPSDMLGDRVLQLNLSWKYGSGSFAKEVKRYLEIDPAQDQLDFYFYNPSANGGDVTFTIEIPDDDDANDNFDGNADDLWQYTVTAHANGGWELFSIPFNLFTDVNPGGNGQFDMGYSGNGGIFQRIAFKFQKNNPSNTFEQYYIDMISVSEGPLPHGAGILDLPPKAASDHCMLGAYTHLSETQPDQVPNEIEPLFPSDNRLYYVNWFLAFSENGNTYANKLPGQEVQNLLNRGYRPIITWEPLYNQYSRLDPVQPRLNDLISGRFDAYFDAFGDKLASYKDTVIVRFMHEFEGNWYPWSLVENGRDPQLYIKAFRYVVDRIRARGAGNVKWMWCINAEPAPYARFNFVKNAYPGDNYVDIVATDIYNHPNLGVPDWKSFRYTAAESYYYLTKYFGHKPFYICEVASRERYSSENSGSQSKRDWLEMMNKDVQSFFSKSKAMVFFSAIKEHDWRVNSSPATLDIITRKIWEDSFYKRVSTGLPASKGNEMSVRIYPNPFSDMLNIETELSDSVYFRVFDAAGRLVFRAQNPGMYHHFNFHDLKAGAYIMEINNGRQKRNIKLVKKS